MAEYKGSETPRVYRSSEPGLPHFLVRRLKSLCDLVPILKDWEINTAGAEGSYLSANLVQPFPSKVVFIIPLDFAGLPALDMLEEIHSAVGFRLSLNHWPRKPWALRSWPMACKVWPGGRRESGTKSSSTARHVDLTRRIYEFGREHGYLLYRDYQGRPVRLPVRFEEKSLLQ